jgi:uncharacterized protein (TIGR00725 family)
MKTVLMSETPFQIGVFGSGTVRPEQYQLAYDVGATLARKGHIVINGGLGGAMEASARGAAEAGGLVIGILPGIEFSEGNRYSTVKVLTGMRYARNCINGLSCHGAIVVSGSSGAYEEARRVWEGRGPVVVVEGSGSDSGAPATMLHLQETSGMAFPEDKPKPFRVFAASSAEAAVAMLLDLLEKGYPNNEQQSP